MPAEPPKPPEAHCWEQTPCEASLLFLSTTFVPETHTCPLLEFLWWGDIVRLTLQRECKVKKLTQACVWVAQSYPTLCNPVDCTRQAPLSMKFSRHGPCSRPLGSSNGASPASLGAHVSQRTALHTGPWLAASLIVDVHTGNGMIGAGRWGSTAQKICQSHSRSCGFFLFFLLLKSGAKSPHP